MLDNVVTCVLIRFVTRFYDFKNYCVFFRLDVKNGVKELYRLTDQGTFYFSVLFRDSYGPYVTQQRFGLRREPFWENLNSRIVEQDQASPQAQCWWLQFLWVSTVQAEQMPSAWSPCHASSEGAGPLYSFSLPCFQGQCSPLCLSSLHLDYPGG